ncbi:Rho GTPase activating protein 25, partial [Reticulomyxa filosa]
MASAQITFRIRIVLPDGSIVQRTSIGSDTFAKIRDFLWANKQKHFTDEHQKKKKKKEEEKKKQMNSEDLVRVYHVFEDLGKPPLERYTILLESPQDYGDQRCHQVNQTTRCEQIKICGRYKPDPKKPLIWHGYLTKCSKRTGKGYWHRRYFVYQGQTLYWYQSVEAFQKDQKAEKWLAMGGVVARLDQEVVRASNKENVFVLDVPQHVSGEHSKDMLVLQAETSQGLRTFIGLVLQHTWNIKVATVLNILPHLKKEVDVEGIFRLAGDKTKIEKIENQIDLGMMPNFATYGEDEVHTKTSLLKRGLRFMEPPLVPTENYENFIRIGRCVDAEERAKQLKSAVSNLPLKHLLILNKLFLFLNF